MGNERVAAGERFRHAVQAISRHKFLAAALLIAIVAAWPVLAEPGLLNTRGGGDSPFLLQRLHQLETAVLDGHFPVRWMPDANYGYGYPFFNYYAPLSIYGAAVYRFIGFSYVRAIHLAQLAGFLAAAWGAFRLARRWYGNEWAGLVTAVAYTVAPFHMVNVYVRGDSLAEFWAMAFYPWVLLAADGVTDGKRRGRAIAGLGVTYAGLILSHNISALIFSPFLLLYLLLRWIGRRQRSDFRLREALPPLAALLLALGLAAWFFVPALVEQSLAQLGPVTEGYFHYSNHFRGADLVQTGFLFDYNPDGGVAFRMGLVQGGTAVLGLLILLAKRGQLRREGLWFTGLTLAIATLMITPLSRPLWEHLPLLSFTQFPWRFLSVQALATALAAGGLALLPWRRIVVPVTAVLLLAAALGRLETDHLILTDADVTAEKLAQYEWFTGNIGSTVSAEYLPAIVQPRPYSSGWLMYGDRWRLQALSGDLGSSQLLDFQTDRQRWRIETAVPTTVQFPTLAWSGWQAQVNGTAVAIRTATGSGLITLDLPAGSHAVELRLARTPIRLAAEITSLLALLITFWLLVPGWRPRRNGRWLLWGTLLLFVAAVGLRLWPDDRLPAGNLTWDFAQMGYLHHADDGVPFGNGAHLERYTISSETAVAGDTVTITLDWREQGTATTATVALATPAVTRPGFDPPPPVLASHTLSVAAGEVSYPITIPADAPPGLYVPCLTLANGRALTPSGDRRGDLFLRPIRIQNRDPATAVSGLEMRGVDARMAANGTLVVTFAYATEQPLPANLNVSLRLLDAAGQIVFQQDTQPGYGFLPSVAWPAGEWVYDRLALAIPTGNVAPPPYTLTANLYEVGSGQTVLVRKLGTLDQSMTFQPPQPAFTLPSDLTPETAVFTTGDTPLIRLAGYRPPSPTRPLALYWQSLTATDTDYTRFVHVLNASGEIVTQVDGFPQGNSYPTSQWMPGEVVADPVTLDLAALPAGEYAIVAGFYENLGDRFPRLTAVTPSGAPIPNNAVPLTTIDIR